MNGDRAGLKRERGGQRSACVLTDGGHHNRLDNAQQAENQGNEEQASLEVAAQRCRDESAEDEDRPADYPQKTASKNADEKHGDGSAVLDKKQREQAWPDAAQDGRGIAKRFDIPARRQREEGDEELKEEIGGGKDELQLDGGVPNGIDAGGVAGQLDKADGRLYEFVQGQPEVLDVALLREIEGEEKDGQHHEKHRVHEPRHPLEEVAIGRHIELAHEIGVVAEEKAAAGEKAGVCAVADGSIDGSHRQRERGFRGRHVEIVDAGDLLIMLRSVAVRSLGLDLAAVGEDLGRQCRGAKDDGSALRNGQFDQQRDGPVIGSQFDMEPEPCVALWDLLAEPFPVDRRAAGRRRGCGAQPRPGPHLWTALASRMAHEESSKPGVAAAGSAVTPTRQSLSRRSGEPKMEASKITGGADGAGIWGGLPWLPCLGGSGR